MALANGNFVRTPVNGPDAINVRNREKAEDLAQETFLRAWTAALYGAAVFAVVWFLFDTLRGDAPVGALIALS